MKKNKLKLLVVVTIFAFFIISNSRLAFAEELKGKYRGSLNALNTGYAITRWPPGSGDLKPGMDATVRACTTEPPWPTATQVVLRWNGPDGSSFDVGPIDLTPSGDTWDGLPIYDAYDTQTLDMMGDWGVQALFIDEDGKLQGPNPYPIVKIKAISWHVIPEVPLGTIATIISMFVALSVFARRVKPSWIHA